MLECPTAATGHRNEIDYEPDELDEWRDWSDGQRFKIEPPIPVIADIDDDRKGVIAELIHEPLPLMSKRLAAAISSAGVSNIDFYEAKINDLSAEKVHHTHLAFNLIGTVAAANMGASEYDRSEAHMISASFDLLVL
jgi:hypothetical protein